MAGPSDAGLSPCPPSSSAGLWLPTMARSFRQLHRAPAHPDRSAGAEFSRCALLLGTAGLIVCDSTVGVSHFGGDAVRGRTAISRGGLALALFRRWYCCVSLASRGGAVGLSLLPASRPLRVLRTPRCGLRAVTRSLHCSGERPAACTAPPPHVSGDVLGLSACVYSPPSPRFGPDTPGGYRRL